MVAARSSSSSSSTSSASALLLRVVLLSFCTLLLCPSMTSATDLRRGSAGLEQLEKPRVDGGVPIVDSTFYVEVAKNKGANQQQQRNGFRSLQEMEGGVTSTVAPTGAPTAAPTASPSAAPTVFSMPEETSAARSWRSSSSSSPVAVGVAMVIAVVAGLAGMA